jgi:hypothetical protein
MKLPCSCCHRKNGGLTKGVPNLAQKREREQGEEVSGFKQPRQMAGCMQNAEDFDPFGCDAVKNTVAAFRQAAHVQRKLITGDTCIRMFGKNKRALLKMLQNVIGGNGIIFCDMLPDMDQIP